MNRSWVQKTLAVGVLAVTMLLGPASRPILAAGTNVAVQLLTLTAPHAALGVPMKYEIVLTNTGSTTTQVNSIVKLIAPDASTYTLLSTSPMLSAGQIKFSSGTFTTSTYTSQTGSFTLWGYITDSFGNILQQQKMTLTVSTKPANGIYVSVGGQGPASAPLGNTTDYQTVTANLGATSQTLKTKTILVEPNATQVVLSFGTNSTLNAGANTIAAGVATTSQYTTQTGTYSVIAQVLNSSNTVLASDTYSFTINALPTSTYAPTFTDTAASSGVGIERSMMGSMPGCGNFTDFMPGGSGAAVADYDGDGRPDIFVTDMMGMNHLWHNNGDGTFTDMAMEAGIPMDMMGMMSSGASFADIDNDGHPDLLITSGPEGMLMLLHNNGNGTFSDITESSGINTNPVPQNYFSVTWGDYDGDGYLDFYVAVHADCNNANTNDHLYHNNGNLTFTDVTSLLGGSTAPQVTGRGLTAMFIDYNQDGRPDLWVGNDIGKTAYPNVLWRNDGPDGHGGWIFTDVSASTGANLTISSMGLAVTDYNRSGRFSLFSSGYGSTALLQQQSNGTFTQVQFDGPGNAHVAHQTLPETAGGTGPAVTWSAGAYDFNNDGWEDLFIAGDMMGAPNQEMTRPNVLFLNHQDGTFLDTSILAAINGSSMAMTSMPTAVFADFNGDGFMDVFDDPMMGAVHLYINNGVAQHNPNHWLEVKLIGGGAGKSNRDAVGARLVANVGGVNLLRQVVNGGNYQANSTLIQHFGLGSASAVTTLTIYWPSGKVSALSNVAANQLLTVTEP